MRMVVAWVNPKSSRHPAAAVARSYQAATASFGGGRKPFAEIKAGRRGEREREGESSFSAERGGENALAWPAEWKEGK